MCYLVNTLPVLLELTYLALYRRISLNEVFNFFVNFQMFVILKRDTEKYAKTKVVELVA